MSNKMFQVRFKADEVAYKEIDELMTTRRKVKPETKSVTNSSVSAVYCLYRSDSFFLTRQLQRRSIWYDLSAV